MGPTPCYSQSQVVFVCQSFRPVVQFFSLVKYFPPPFFLSMEKGCDHIEVLTDRLTDYSNFILWISHVDLCSI